MRNRPESNPVALPPEIVTALDETANERGILTRWAEKMIAGTASFPTADKKAHAQTILRYERIIADLTAAITRALREQAYHPLEALQQIAWTPLDDAAPCAEAGDSAAADFWRETAYHMAQTANAGLRAPSPGTGTEAER